MDTDNTERVIKIFLRKQRALPPGDSPLTRLRLVHLGTKSVELWAHDVEGSIDEDSLVAEIVTAAADDAEGIGGLQKYKLEAYFGRKTVGRMQRFSIDAREDEGFDAETSEAANAKGLVAQSMRHAEIFMKTSVGASHQVINQLLRQNETYAKRIEELEAKLTDAFDIRERLLTEESQREIMKAQALSDEKRKDEIVDTVKSLVPVVASKIGLSLPANAGGSDDESAAIIMQVKAFVDGIKPEQLAKIANTLTPPQQILLMELAGAVKRKGD